ncbi:MAG: 16S rRNA (guanine(527)-N(7))-methyltransferase RsmG, partial [Spirochaetia bacterium]|nr:16S rRNA (guanine(527)-N(7))-methyltransferase RsmG [Spirochaetia bacterium]
MAFRQFWRSESGIVKQTGGGTSIDAGLLGRMLAASGIKLSRHQTALLWEYHKLLRLNNPILNLTRIHNFENMVRKHYVDSLIILDILASRKIDLQSPVMDLGSGPGLPGIPLAIARPDLRFVLAEGRRNRCEFLEETARNIELENVSVVAVRVTRDYQDKVGTVITRAVTSMEETIDRISGCLSPGGLLVFMKGPNCGDEIHAVKNKYGEACPLLFDEAYTLPDSADERRLVVFRWLPEKAGIRPGDRIDQEGKPYNVISSEENARFKKILSLQSSRMVRKHGEAIVCGERIAAEILEHRPESVVALVLPEVREVETPAAAVTDAKEAAAQNGIPVWIFSRDLFRQLDAVGAGPPLLVVRTRDIPEWDPDESADGIRLFLPLSDPDNLGAALRSAAAFGVKTVVLSQEAANPYHYKSIRASAGVSLSMNYARAPDL